MSHDLPTRRRVHAALAALDTWGEVGVRYISLFSGIESATVAWHPLGWTPVAFAEIDKFPSAVLAHHYPDVPNLGSVTDITDEQIKALGPIDLVVGGSPCQDLSVAGKRAGLDGERSGLFSEQMRIFHAARRLCGARWCLWENVPGAFSTNSGRDFAVVVGELAGARLSVPRNGWQSAGVALGENGLCEWRVLDAQFFGLAQRRRRVFALLDTGDWRSRFPVLLEREGVRGDSPPSRQAGQGTTYDVAPSLTGSGRGVERAGESRGQDPVVAVLDCPEVSPALKARDHKGPSSDGDGDGAPILPVAFSSKDHGADAMEDLSPTLRAGGHDSSHANAGVPPAIAFHPTQDPISSEEVSHALSANANANATAAVAFDTTQITSAENRSNPQPGDPCHPLAAGAHPPAVIFKPSHYTRGKDGAPSEVTPPLSADADKGEQDAVALVPDARAVSIRGREGGGTAELGDTVQNALRASQGGGDKPHVLQNMAVRRLTPVECERLMGVPDNYTQIPWRGKPAGQCPDGPRYKALGNSMAVPVMRWIGSRIQYIQERAA